MCIDSPESTTNYLSPEFRRRWRWLTPKFWRRVQSGFVLFFGHVDMFGHFPRISAGAWCSECSITQGDEPFLSVFLGGPFRKNRLGFRRLYILEYATKLQGKRTFSTTFLRLCGGLNVNLFVPEYALFAEFASRLRFVFLTQGRMPKITWRIRAVSLKLMFWSCSKRARLCHLSTLTVVVAEAASTSFCRHCSFAFHWKQCPCFLSTLPFFPFRIFYQYSCFYLSLYHGLPLLITWLQLILIDFLFVHCQNCLELIRLSYSHLAQIFQNLVIGNLTSW